jgi:hypothetical protein
MEATRETSQFEKEVFTYLNDLRESGVTNMFGARPYIVRQFGVNENKAGQLLALWMTNFNNEGNYETIKNN